MSVDTSLDSSFTNLLAKARSGLGTSGAVATTSPTATPRSTTINFGWGGGGVALNAASTDPMLIEVPLSSQLVYAHLYAGDAAGRPVAVSATVDVQLSSVLTFGGFTALHGSGVRPSLTLDAATNCPIAGWQTSFVTGDAVIARLLTFTGAATWLVLVLMLRPTDSPIGVQNVVNASGDTYVDADGNTYVFRG